MRNLVAYDGSAPSQKALEYAAREYPDEEIILLRVLEASDGSLEAGVELLKEHLKTLRKEQAAETSEEVNEIVNREDLKLELEMTIGKPARKIVEFAEENDVDRIIIGNHGREGVSRVLLGSVAEQVVRRSPTTVIVVR